MSTLPDHGAARLPRDVGVRLSHATVQAIADREGIEVLHIKGPVVDETLRLADLRTTGGDVPMQPRGRDSVDADVLVDPDQAGPLITALGRHGWQLAWDFDEGSLFAHAATLQHPFLPHVDVHRWFPGIERDPASAFAILLEGADRVALAEFPCQVPAMDTHRLILLLHAARSRRSGGPRDVSKYWTGATAERQVAVRQLAERLDATVALAAAIGELDSVRHHRSYRLWSGLQQAHPTHRETLMGHLVASRPREVVPLLARFLMLNKRRIDRERGGAVGLRDTLAAYGTWVSRRVRG